MFNFRFGRTVVEADGGSLGGQEDEMQVSREMLLTTARELRKLLFEQILPLWSTIGADLQRGGYAETLSSSGHGKPGPRRIRVSARQVYSFCEAAELGWNSTAATACVRHGYRFLITNTGADGLLYHTLDQDNAVLDQGHVLADQAFLLLAYARAHALLGDEDIVRRARRLLTTVIDQFAHAEGGYGDRTDRPFPLRSNPHMHLLEAALAWIAVSPEAGWIRFADEIVALAKRRLIDRQSGFVLEDFDPQWVPLDQGGRLRVVPGHNFEWAWLLLRWEELTGGDAEGLPQRMAAAAETTGLDSARQVVVNEITSEGQALDPKARLWPQTERLKAWLALADRNFGRESWEAEQKALEAAATLRRFIEDRPGGLWRDTMLEDGSFEPGDAPASSLYHIICAIGEFLRYAQRSEDSLATRPAEAEFA